MKLKKRVKMKLKKRVKKVKRRKKIPKSLSKMMKQRRKMKSLNSQILMSRLHLTDLEVWKLKPGQFQSLKNQLQLILRSTIKRNLKKETSLKKKMMKMERKWRRREDLLQLGWMRRKQSRSKEGRSTPAWMDEKKAE